MYQCRSFLETGTERGGKRKDLGTGKSWVRGCEVEDTLTLPQGIYGARLLFFVSARTNKRHHHHSALHLYKWALRVVERWMLSATPCQPKKSSVGLILFLQEQIKEIIIMMLAPPAVLAFAPAVVVLADPRDPAVLAPAPDALMLADAGGPAVLALAHAEIIRRCRRPRSPCMCIWRFFLRPLCAHPLPLSP